MGDERLDTLDADRIANQLLASLNRDYAATIQSSSVGGEEQRVTMGDVGEVPPEENGNESDDDSENEVDPYSLGFVPLSNQQSDSEDEGNISGRDSEDDGQRSGREEDGEPEGKDDQAEAEAAEEDELHCGAEEEGGRPHDPNGEQDRFRIDPFDENHVATIRNVMANIKLPAAKRPTWMDHVSEEKWISHLVAQVSDNPRSKEHETNSPRGR